MHGAKEQAGVNHAAPEHPVILGLTAIQGEEENDKRAEEGEHGFEHRTDQCPAKMDDSFSFINTNFKTKFFL